LLALFGSLAYAQDTLPPAGNTQSPTSEPQRPAAGDQSQQPLPPNATPSAPAQTAPAAITQRAPAEHKKVFYVELGGSYTIVNNSSDRWKSGSVKIAYNGSKRFSPFFTVSSQTRDAGTQQAYGFGSYITINKRFYSMVGIGGAPDNGVVLNPLIRYGAALLGAVPKVPGLVASIGFSDLRYSTPGGGEIYSTGAIYYHRKLILSGNVNFNRDRLSGVVSESGQAGFMYGSQGKYWFGAGLNGGKEAYQAFAPIPFDVRFNNIGSSIFMQKWVTKSSGFIVRYEYMDKLTAFQLHGLSAALFFSF
jgi:YaiO family outer membrane protein